MSDIVKRLLEHADQAHECGSLGWRDTMNEAAARIERLEARLRFWCKAHEAQETELFIAAYESTRAALGEKK